MLVFLINHFFPSKTALAPSSSCFAPSYALLCAKLRAEVLDLAMKKLQLPAEAQGDGDGVLEIFLWIFGLEKRGYLSIVYYHVLCIFSLFLVLNGMLVHDIFLGVDRLTGAFLAGS